jgi:hypothetical protein
MKRKFLSVAIAGGLMLGGAGIANAGHTEDGSGHKPQDHGLCTAFHNGNKNGWAKNGTPGPFADLMARAGDADGNGTAGQASDVTAFCGALTGGNPGPNGQSAGKGQGGN